MHVHLGGLIAILGGIWAVLAAFGVVRVSKNPEANELWRRKFGPMMKIIGPIVILFGVAIFFGLLQ